MPIIINEFEIVADPRTPEPAPDQTAALAEPPPPLYPEDIVRIERRYYERMNRIRAD